MSAEQFVIQRAERKQARLRFAIGAASNGGKTWSAIEIAFGLVEELLTRGVLAGTLEGKVGLVDTERRSGHLYSHLGPYDVIELAPPYSVERYVGAMQALERAGVAVVILDSISHAWVGPGGVLTLLDRFEDRERFSQFGKTLNPAQDEFVDAMLRSPCHVIATMRSKTAWVLEQKQKGDRVVNVPKRIGMAPIQRPGIEYEFTTMVDLDTETHAARVVKNRCPVFAAWTPRVLTREHGRQLAAWLLEGAPAPTEPLSGTPLERAQATHAAGVRNMHRCENLPDLGRVFADCDRQLRGFVPGVSTEEIAEMRRKLTEEKDLCKKSLGAPSGAPVQPGPYVDPALVTDLEQMLQEAEVPLEQCREKFGVTRLTLLPAARLQEAAVWIHDTALDRSGIDVTLPARLAAAGVVLPKLPAPAARGSAARFADMEDDLPWRDDKSPVRPA